MSKDQSTRSRSRFELEALESRVLLSADLLGAGTALAHHHHHHSGHHVTTVIEESGLGHSQSQAPGYDTGATWDILSGVSAGSIEAIGTASVSEDLIHHQAPPIVAVEVQTTQTVTPPVVRISAPETTQTTPGEASHAVQSQTGSSATQLTISRFSSIQLKITASSHNGSTTTLTDQLVKSLKTANGPPAGAFISSSATSKNVVNSSVNTVFYNGTRSAQSTSKLPLSSSSPSPVIASSSASSNSQPSDLTASLNAELTLYQNGSVTGQVTLSLGDLSLGSMVSFHNLKAVFNVAYTNAAFSGSVTITADSASLSLGSTVTSTIKNISGTYALPGKTFSLTFGSTDLTVSSFVTVHADSASLTYDPNASTSVTLTNGSALSSKNVSVLTIGMTGVTIFAGLNGPADNSSAVGIKLTNADFAMALFRSTSDSSVYYAIKTTADEIAPIGLPSNITMSAADLSVEINSSNDSGRVVDFTKFGGGKFTVNTGANTSEDFDFGGSLVKVAGTLTLGIGDYISLTGSFSFNKTSSLVTIDVGHTAFEGATDATLELGPSGNPYVSATGSLSMQFDSTAVTINSANLTVSTALKLGSILEVDTLSISLAYISIDRATGAISGAVDGSGTVQAPTLTITAAAATFFPGNESINGAITATQGGDGLGLKGVFNLQTHAFSITLEHVNLEVGSVVTADADNVVITYDPSNSDPHQQLVQIESATVNFSKFSVTGSISNLVIYADGFHFDSVTLGYTGTVKIGVLTITDPSVTLTDFGITFTGGNASFDATGTLTVAAASATLDFGASTFTASATGLSISVSLDPATFGNVNVKADTLSIQISTLITLHATDITVNTNPDAGDAYLSVGSATVSLTVGSLSLTGSATDFSLIKGSSGAAFHAGDNFSVTISASASQLSLPDWLGFDIQKLELKWDDFAAHPERFTIYLSASISSIHGLPGGVTVSGYVQNAVIDIGALEDGKFPITDIGSFGGSVTGKLFGLDVNASFLIGVVKFNAAGGVINQDGSVINANGTTTATGGDTTVAGSTFYVGISGGAKIEGLGGVQIYLGFSKLGPLTFYIDAQFPLLLDPDTGLAIGGFTAGVSFGTTITAPNSPTDLRTITANLNPENLSISQWNDQLRVQSVAQYRATNGGQDLTAAYNQPIVIQAGVTFYDAYLTENSFKITGNIAIGIDPSQANKVTILLSGTATFGDSVSFNAYFYAAIDGNPGAVTPLATVFLFDEPANTPVESIGGSFSFSFTDSNGNALNPTLTHNADGSFNAAQQAGGFAITITGFVQYSAAGALSLTIHGQVTLTVTTNFVKLDLGGSVNITGIGDLATAQGELVVDYSNPDDVKFYGALTLATGDATAKLENVGLHVSGAVTFEFNSTGVQQTVNIPGVNVGDPATAVIIDGPTIFDMLIGGTTPGSFATISYEKAGKTIFDMEAVFDLRVTASGLQMFANLNRLTIGPIDDALLTFHGYGLVVIDDTGFAAELSLSLQSQLYTDISFNANFTLVMNTTSHDVSYTIPDTLPALSIYDADGNVTGAVRTLTIARGPPQGLPQSDGTFASVGATGPYIVIVGDGDLSLTLSSGSLDFNGFFRFELSSSTSTSSLTVSLIVDMTCKTSGIPGLSGLEVEGAFQFNKQGVVALLEIGGGASSSTEYGNGVTLDARFEVGINTTSSDVSSIGGIGLTDPDGNAITITSHGYLIAGSGTLTLAFGGTGFTISGSIFASGNSTSGTISVSGTLTATVGGATLLTAQANGTLVYNASGVAGQLTVTVTGNNPLSGSGFSFSGSFELEVNTTGKDVALSGGGTIYGGANHVSTNSGSPYVQIHVTGSIIFGTSSNGFALNNIDFFMSVSGSGLAISGSADLAVMAGGTQLVSASGTAALVINSQGFAATITVTAHIGDGSHYYLGGTFTLMVNTTGQQQLAGAVTIPAAAQGLSAGPYFQLSVSGYMMLGTGSSSTSTGFYLSGSFYLTISSSGLAITASATLRLNISGNTLFSFSANAAFLISSGGIAGKATLTISAGGTGTNFGFNASASFELDMNFTNAPVNQIGNQTVNLPIGPYLKISVTATLTLASILDVNGSFTLTIDSGSLVIHLDATLRLFGITFGVSGDAGIYWLGSNTGIAVNLNLSLGGNSSNPEATLIPGVLALQAQFQLQINTTGATHFGISGSTILHIAVSNANVYVFGFKMVSASLDITVGANHFFSCSGMLDFDFFGFGTVHISFDFNSNGKYTFDGTLGVKLGSNSFNIHGSLYVHISNESGPNFEMRVEGGATAFGYDFASIGADVQINGSSVDISVYVSVDLGLFSVGGTIHIHLGTLTPLPAPPPPPALGRVVNGVLYLNIAQDATTYRGVGPLTDEYYELSSAGGSNVYVSAPGVYTGAGVDPNGNSVSGAPNDTVMYSGVTSIVVTSTGTSNTTIKINNNVTQHVTITAGSGTNQFMMGGGSSTITGSTGADKVIGGSGAVTFIAGTGKSTFIGGAANNSVTGSTNVTILESGYTTYTLSNTLLNYGSYSDTLNGVFTITLTAPTSGATTFTVTNFSHAVTLDGNNNTSVSASVSGDTDLTLNGYVVQESNGGVITMKSVQTISLHGGASANTLTVSGWSGGGTVSLDGADGADSYKINLQGSGSQTINVNDSGTSGNDSLLVIGTGSADTLNIAGGSVARSSETVNYTGIESLTVNTLGGNDTVNINKPTAALIVNGGTGTDTFNIKAIDSSATLVLGAGTNTVNVGTLAPTITGGTLNNIKAVLTVQGAIGGTTVLNLDDSADNSQETAVLDATSLTGVFGLGGSLQYSNIGTFNLTLGNGRNSFTVVGNGSATTNITLGGGNDSLNVQGTTGVLTVNLGGGANTVNLGSAAPGTGGILGRLNGIINLTGNGNDIMNVDDSGSLVGETGTLRSNSLTFLDPVTINYSGFGTMNISLSQGGDLFAIVDTFTSSSTTPVIVIDGNGGDDIFSILDTHAVTTINGDDGNDSIYVFGNSSVLNLFGNDGDDSFYIFASVLPGTQSPTNLDGGAADSNGNQYYSYRVNATVNIDGGAGNDKVFIFGTVLNDVITIDGTHVTGAGVDVHFTNCEALVVAGMGGDDTFYIENIAIDTTVMGEGSLPVFPPGVTPPDLTGGAPPATSFNDTFYVGWAGKFVPGSLSGINATLTIEGDDGVDTAYIDNSADTVNRTFTLTSTTLDSTAMGSNGHIVYDSTVDNLNIQSGAGNDTFIVNGTGAGLQTTLWGAAGNDTFIVNAPLTTPLAINGDANTFVGDTLTINGTGFGNNFVITGFTVDGTGATISYATVETLTINGVSGNNSFTLNGDSVPTFLNGGTDNDTFVVNANSVPAVLNGGAGNDLFTITGNSGPLAANGGDGNDTFVVNGNSANLTLSGGNNNDSFTINGSSGSLTVSGNDGNDTFVVNSLSAPSSIDGGAGDDVFTINLPLAAVLNISGGTGSGDSLTINGTAGNDFWVITNSTVGGVGATVNYANIDALTVNGLNGNDTFNIQSTGNATTLVTGAGLNTINVGSLAPTMNGGTIAGIQGALTVSGNGNDVLNLDNTGAVAGQSATLTDTSLTGLGMAGITYSGIKTFNISLGQGADTVVVLNTAAATTTNINADSGNDVFNVQATTGLLDLNGGAGDDTFNFSSIAPLPGGNVNAIAGQVNVIGGGGSDTINVDDSADTTSNNGTLTASSLTGLGLGGGIGYSGIAALNIHIGSGDDSFNIQGTSAVTTLNTGGGTNTVNIGSNAPGSHGILDLVQGALTILGSENDTLNIDDSGSTVSKMGTLTPETLTGLGMGQGGITFLAIRNMNICLGSGNDSLTINEITNSTLTTIKGGAGQDTITLNFAGNYAAERLSLISFETGTLSVGANFTGLLNDDGTLTSVSIGGSLTTSGILNVAGLGTVTIGSDVAGLVNDTGSLDAIIIGGNLTATGVLNASSIGSATIEGNVCGLVNDTGSLGSALIEGSIQQTGILNAASISSLTVNGDVAGIINDAGALTSGEIGGAITATGVLNAASINTLLIGANLAGSVNVSGTATSITIEGSISSTGVFNAGSIRTMTIDGDLAGLVNVDGLLDVLLVQGGTPGLIVAGDVHTITVEAGYDNKVLQVIEGRIDRQIQALPIGGGQMPNDVLFAFSYDSTGNTPILTIHISNESDTRFDLALVVHSASAKFDLGLVDASGASGIGNISVEGDILGGLGGVRLPTDYIIGVEARDGLTVGSVHVAGLEGFAFGTLIWGNTKPVKITSEMIPSTVATILGSNAALLPANDAFRVPFSENHSVTLFAESDHDADFDLAATFTDTISDNVGITAVIQMQPSNTGEDAVVITNLALLGNGASVNTGASVSNITSTGTLHDLYIGGQAGLGSLTASAITGKVTVAKGGITGTIQTTGILTDAFTGVQTAIAGDIGNVVTGKNNKLTTTTLTSKGGLTGQIIARGNIISTISVHGMAAGSTIAAQGDIGAMQQNNSNKHSTKNPSPVRLGGITITGNDAGTIISVGNIIADIRVTGTLSGRIAAEGQSNDNLGEGQVGILGNIKVGKFASSAAIISGGEIGDTALKTTLTAGKSTGIVAALGSVHLAHSTKVLGHLFTNLGSDDLLNASQVTAVFTDESEPLSFDLSRGDLQGLSLIKQDLNNLSTDGDGDLTGANP